MKIGRFFFSSHTVVKPVRLGSTKKTSFSLPATTILSQSSEVSIPSQVNKTVSILDKTWNEKPMSIIKSPHKLSEVELYETLQKIVEMPEKRLK